MKTQPPAPSGRKTSEKPTLADVARLAGVSTATVSYVLNNRMSEVSQGTAERVRLAVRQLGYVKNLTASALSGKTSNMIAVITIGAYHPNGGDTEINPFFGEFLFRLEAEARRKGYALCLYGGREEEYVHFLLERYVDAAVLVGFSEWDLPGVLERQDLHLVLYDSFGDDDKRSHVRTDEVKGGALAAEHMISHGRQRLVFLGDSPAVQSGNIPANRYKGAQRFCDAAGVALQFIETPTTYGAGLKAAEAVVASGADAVVTTADILAAGLMEGLHSRGVTIPDDIAVMGYDNLPLAQHVRPKLSTIDQGLTDKVTAVMELVESGKPGGIRVIEPTVVVRESA